MRPALSLRKRPLVVPEPGQRVRLRTARGRWRGSFRAVSEPFTGEGGVVVLRVAQEEEYRAAVHEGRRAISMPWPVWQVEVASFREDGEETQELPRRLHQDPQRAEPRPGAGSPQEGAERPWWRRMFGG
jgi:hypothetical protein